MQYLPPGTMVDVGGFRLHLNCSGVGSPPVILDSALGGSSLSWSLVQPALAGITTVCSYDRAGFGWSDAGPFPRTAGRIADELRQLLARARVPPPFVIVGHSFGGLVMRLFAIRYRADVAALVLVDPAHPEEWIEPGPDEQLKIARGLRLCRYGQSAARTGVAGVVSALVELGALNFARAIVRVVSRGNFSREDEGILAPLWRLPAEARRPLRYFWKQERFFNALSSQIQCICESAAETLDAGTDAFHDLPLVTMSCTDPGGFRLQLQEKLVRQSRAGRHVVASNSGHWIPLDQPEIVIETITRVVSEAKGMLNVES